MTGLRRHIPELAIEWALDEPDRLWRAIDGTLCFADISGFTALSEKLSRRGRIGGEELVETLSRVFGGMLDSARERDGMLLKFGGDALLFLFKGKDHALRAASTAVEMRQALRKAREIPTSVGPLDLSMSVGLHSGTVHFFLVGSTHRELVLAGPAASIAVAMESAANAGEIGLSAATAALLPASAVRAREDGLLLLKWRKPPSPPPGASPERAAGAEVLRGLFPRALGEVLARGAPEAEHRVACIAFVRFSGTDALLEHEGPDAVAHALDATIGTAQRIFETEDITLLAVDVDKDGGKLFLGAGVPQASEDDEGRMLRALRRLADERTPLPLQFGVNRGHVFAAEVGTPRPCRVLRDGRYDQHRGAHLRQGAAGRDLRASLGAGAFADEVRDRARRALHVQGQEGAAGPVSRRRGEGGDARAQGRRTAAGRAARGTPCPYRGTGCAGHGRWRRGVDHRRGGPRQEPAAPRRRGSPRRPARAAAARRALRYRQPVPRVSGSDPILARHRARQCGGDARAAGGRRRARGPHAAPLARAAWRRRADRGRTLARGRGDRAEVQAGPHRRPPSSSSSIRHGAGHT